MVLLEKAAKRIVFFYQKSYIFWVNLYIFTFQQNNLPDYITNMDAKIIYFEKR